MRLAFLSLVVLLFGAPRAEARTLDCGYVAGADNLLHVLCEDLEAEDDPALEDPGRPRFWRIPVWSAAPYPDSDPARLVRAVLCPRKAPCEVRFEAASVHARNGGHIARMARY